VWEQQGYCTTQDDRIAAAELVGSGCLKEDARNG